MGRRSPRRWLVYRWPTFGVSEPGAPRLRFLPRPIPPPQARHLILIAGNSGGMTDPIVTIPLEEIGARTLEFGEAVETACKA